MCDRTTAGGQPATPAQNDLPGRVSRIADGHRPRYTQGVASDIGRNRELALPPPVGNVAARVEWWIGFGGDESFDAADEGVDLGGGEAGPEVLT